MEQYQNLSQTTLNGNITSSATSITVTSGTALPATGNFRLLIGTEILICTAIASNVLTVIRGQEGTTGASHTSGDAVYAVLTAGALNQVLTDLNQTDVLANLPTAAKAGRIYVANDAPYGFRDNGSSQDPFYPLSPFTLPILGDTSWVNQGGASILDTFGCVSLFVPTESNAGVNIHCRVKPKTPPYKITGYFNLVNAGLSFQSGGMGFYDSVSGQLQSMHFIVFGGNFGYVEICNWVNANFFNNAPTNMMISNAGIRANWMQIEHDGTNLTYRVGNDGKHWLDVGSYGKTSFLSNDPDNVFYYGRNDSGFTGPNNFDLLSWKEE